MTEITVSFSKGCSRLICQLQGRPRTEDKEAMQVVLTSAFKARRCVCFCKCHNKSCLLLYIGFHCAP